MGGKIKGTGKRISRKKIEQIAKKMSDILGADVFIGGSYSRGKEDSGDVDLLVKGKQF